MKKNILVVGSLKHSLADRCIGWDEIKNSDSIPYFGEYHSIIINLKSFNQAHLDEKMEKALGIIRNQINEIIWANTEIICITAPTIMTKTFVVERGGGSFPSSSNYHWSPIFFDFIEEIGKEFEPGAEDKYFQFVKKWTHFLNRINSQLYKLQKRKSFNVFSDSLLENLAQKKLSFRIYFKEFNEDRWGNETDSITSNSIIFYPPPTEISVFEAIDYLLKRERRISEQKPELPEWSKEVFVAGEKRIKEDIIEKEKKKEEISTGIKKLYDCLGGKIEFKRLLTSYGEEELEGIVEKVLKDILEVDIKLGPKMKEDRIIIDPDTKSEVPLEITGKVHSIPESKLNQIIGRLDSEERITKIRCISRGVLIGNHYMNTPLDPNLKGRKHPFESNVIDKAKNSKISLISTIELFKAVNAKLDGEDKKVKEFTEKIFNNSGEIKFDV